MVCFMMILGLREKDIKGRNFMNDIGSLIYIFVYLNISK